ncbi:MAG: sugar ABC transporter ATP-binding protein [Mycobacteriales bacterium]
MSTTVSAPARLRLQDISKRYGGVRAVRHAEMTVRAGKVHALVGENGAGKSTLIKIIAGAVTADTGTISYDGSVVRITSTAGAIGLGVATVYQEPQLFAELSVAENIFLGRELRRGARIDWTEQNERVVALLERLGVPSELSTTPVGELSIANQQQVSIAKALAGDATVLILDEPSAILTDTEIDVLFDAVRRLTEEGVAVIYISHRLDELFRIADEVTIMRDGSTIGTYPIADLTVRQIAEKMVGGILGDQHARRAPATEEVVLELDRLSRAGAFSDISLAVRAGEVVGLYGLVGSGVADIASTVYGMARATSGTMRVGGKPARPSSPRQAQRLGIALLPADRKNQGMFAFQSIAFNISAGHLPLLTRFAGWIDRARERAISKDMIARLKVRTPNEREPISSMSGGNAQKVVLARALVERPKALVLAEPTQGVDVGAKEEIHRIIDELAESGTAVLVATADLSEALRISDRLLVIRAGHVVAEFGPQASQVDVLAAAAGAEDDAAAGPGADRATGGAAR